LLKPKPKQLLWPVKTTQNNRINQSEVEAIARNGRWSIAGKRLQASQDWFFAGYTSYWLKKIWREVFGQSQSEIKENQSKRELVSAFNKQPLCCNKKFNLIKDKEICYNSM